MLPHFYLTLFEQRDVSSQFYVLPHVHTCLLSDVETVGRTLLVLAKARRSRLNRAASASSVKLSLRGGRRNLRVSSAPHGTVYLQAQIQT